jgi:hypothetical protein
VTYLHAVAGVPAVDDIFDVVGVLVVAGIPAVPRISSVKINTVENIIFLTIPSIFGALGITGVH